MSCKPELIPDPDDPSSLIVNIEEPFLSTIPLDFSNITIFDEKPLDATGITFQLLIKVNRTDADGAALVNVGNGPLNIGDNPLTVNFDLDTATVAGFGVGTFFGELWATNATGKDRVSKMLINLSDAVKKTA